MPSNKRMHGVAPVASLAALLAFLGGCSTQPKPVPVAAIAPPQEAAETATTVVDSPVSTPVQAIAPVAAAPATVTPVSSAQTVVPTPVYQPKRAVPDPLAQQMFDDAIQAMKAGRIAEAEQTLGTIARTHPELGGAMANLGLIHRQAGRLPQSLEALDKAIQASPNQAIFHQQRGLTLKEMGRFPDARAAYERALVLNPNYALAALNLGVLLDLYLGDASAALAQFQRYLELTPAGDPVVTKWIAELKNRKPEAAPAQKEPS